MNGRRQPSPGRRPASRALSANPDGPSARCGRPKPWPRDHLMSNAPMVSHMRSDTIKRGDARAAHRSLLRATGVGEGDWDKPFIAVCNSHVDIIPGHVHLQAVGNYVKECVRAAGGVPSLFNTIGVDDGIAMGHNGMKYSLPSRELIAGSAETM